MFHCIMILKQISSEEELCNKDMIWVTKAFQTPAWAWAWWAQLVSWSSYTTPHQLAAKYKSTLLVWSQKAGTDEDNGLLVALWYGVASSRTRNSIRAGIVVVAPSTVEKEEIDAGDVFDAHHPIQEVTTQIQITTMTTSSSTSSNRRREEW